MYFIGRLLRVTRLTQLVLGFLGPHRSTRARTPLREENKFSLFFFLLIIYVSIKLRLAINHFDKQFKTVHEYNTGPDLGGGQTRALTLKVLIGERQIAK